MLWAVCVCARACVHTHRWLYLRAHAQENSRLNIMANVYAITQGLVMGPVDSIFL